MTVNHIQVNLHLDAKSIDWNPYRAPKKWRDKPKEYPTDNTSRTTESSRRLGDKCEEQLGEPCKEPFLKQQPFWAFAKTALCRIITLTRLLTQHLRHCSFCLRGAYYVASLTQLAYASLRNSGFRLRKPLTPSTHTKGGFGFWKMLFVSEDGRKLGDKCRQPSGEPFLKQ